MTHIWFDQSLVPMFELKGRTCGLIQLAVNLLELEAETSKLRVMIPSKKGGETVEPLKSVTPI